jgi:hypothetical protein
MIYPGSNSRKRRQKSKVKIKIKIRRDEVWNEVYLRLYLLIKENKRTWASAAALFGLGGGFLAPIVGTLLNLIDWLRATGVAHSQFYKVSMVFYALTLPLLALGAHCLDLLEKKSPFLLLPAAEKIKTGEFDLGLKA